MSSYSLMLVLKVGESVGNPPPPPIALPMLAIALGRFFITSSGEVNAIVFGPNGLNCDPLSAPDLNSLGLVPKRVLVDGVAAKCHVDVCPYLLEGFPVNHH